MVKVFPPLLHVLVVVIAIGLATTASSSREQGQSPSSDNNASNFVGIQEVNAQVLRRVDADAVNEHHELVEGGLHGLFEEIELSDAQRAGSRGGIATEHCDAADRQSPHPRGCSVKAKRNLRGSSNRKVVAHPSRTSPKASGKEEGKKAKKRFLRWAGEQEIPHESVETTTDAREAVGNAASLDVGASGSPPMADKEGKRVKKRFLRWAGEQETHHEGAVGNATSPDVGASASPPMTDKKRDAGATTLARQIRGSPSAAVVSD